METWRDFSSSSWNLLNNVNIVTKWGHRHRKRCAFVMKSTLRKTLRRCRKMTQKIKHPLSSGWIPVNYSDKQLLPSLSKAEDWGKRKVLPLNSPSSENNGTPAKGELHDHSLPREFLLQSKMSIYKHASTLNACMSKVYLKKVKSD